MDSKGHGRRRGWTGRDMAEEQDGQERIWRKNMMGRKGYGGRTGRRMGEGQDGPEGE